MTKKLAAKILAVLLVLTMFFSIVGCDNSKKPEEKDPEVQITKVAFPTLDYLYNTSDGHKAIAEYLQSALLNAGITMNITNQEWNTFLETRKKGDYSVARNGWLADYNDPISFLDMWTSGSGNNDVQFGKGAHADLKLYSIDLTSLGYEDKVDNGTWAETYDVLIAKVKACTDTAKRYALMHMAEDLLMSTGCIVPLYFYTDLFMIDDDVNGFYSNPLGYKYFQDCDVAGNTDSIAVCLASEPATIDPALNSAVDGATMINHLFSGLAKWALVDGKLEIVADSAEALTEGVVNADGTVTYTYTIREGMKWSNGDEVKASDFVNAWNRAAAPATGADYGYMFEIVDGYAEMNAEDADPAAVLNAQADDAARTITITIENAANYWNELLAFPTYFPVHPSAIGNESWATNPKTYISNGAYTLAAWDHNSVITLAKNEHFYDAANIKMKEIKCYLSDDASNMLANFKTGDWKLIDDVPTAEIATLKAEYPTEFKIEGQIGTYYVCWNINLDLLPGCNLTGVDKEKAQVEVRKAISLLYDRNYIVTEIAQGGQVPASSFVAMGLTDADGSQFYKNTKFSADFDGYFNVATEAFEENFNSAIATLQKYYTNIKVAE